jgi:hypothetical protein
MDSIPRNRRSRCVPRSSCEVCIGFCPLWRPLAREIFDLSVRMLTFLTSIQPPRLVAVRFDVKKANNPEHETHYRQLKRRQLVVSQFDGRGAESPDFWQANDQNWSLVCFCKLPVFIRSEQLVTLSANSSEMRTRQQLEFCRKSRM